MYRRFQPAVTFLPHGPVQDVGADGWFSYADHIRDANSSGRNAAAFVHIKQQFVRLLQTAAGRLLNVHLYLHDAFEGTRKGEWTGDSVSLASLGDTRASGEAEAKEAGHAVGAADTLERFGGST